ncbi:MAG: hypothetical protein ACM3IJ_04790 [Candidatus Levyibacteriota bacterium]
MSWIFRLYIFFVAIILTTTTGFGIAAFYPQPISPRYPISNPTVIVPKSCYATPQEAATPECQKIYAQLESGQTQNIQAQQDFENKMEAYNNINAGYTRTAIFLGISVGALFAILGIGIIRFSPLVANGVILAGVLTAILTRFLIMLASLGSSATGSSSADALSYVEFTILLMLSAAVLFVGFTTLRSLQVKTK